MTVIKWDDDTKRLYETGTRRGVLYKKRTVSEGAGKPAGSYGTGVPWNGLRGVTETPSGAEETALYANDRKYLSLYSAEEIGVTITAYTYPDEWAECDGSAEIATGVSISQQERVGFGLCYRTVVGNDAQGENYGYKLHLLYNAKASPSERSYATINDSPEAIEFSWECSTVPVEIDGYKKTALLTIDSDKVDSDKLTEFENILYGTDGTESYDAVTPVGTENPSTEGWYERSGSAGSYTYTLTADTTVDNQKTYYAKTTTGGTEPRLPLPDEVIRHFGVTTGG